MVHQLSAYSRIMLIKCLFELRKVGEISEGEPAGKPGSVVGNHSSGTHVAVGLKQPTRKRTRIGAALSRLLLSRR